MHGASACSDVPWNPAVSLTYLLNSVLTQVIKKFRDEELEHHDIGLEHDAKMVGTPATSLPPLLHLGEA